MTGQIKSIPYTKGKRITLQSSDFTDKGRSPFLSLARSVVRKKGTDVIESYKTSPTKQEI